VTEGGEAVWVQYTFLRNPTTLCEGEQDCHIFVDIIPKLTTKPRYGAQGENIQRLPDVHAAWHECI
jgi:hypothetical protein